jgi:hypothetical protein
LFRKYLCFHLDTLTYFRSYCKCYFLIESKDLSSAQEFYDSKGICKQNFLKYYRRYVSGGRDLSSLIPHKTGRKFKESECFTPEVLERIKESRSKGYNRYDIQQFLKQYENVEISPSSIYRLMKKLGLNRLNPKIKLEHRKIIKMNAGDRSHRYPLCNFWNG